MYQAERKAHLTFAVVEFAEGDAEEVNICPPSGSKKDGGKAGDEFWWVGKVEEFIDPLGE